MHDLWQTVKHFIDGLVAIIVMVSWTSFFQSVSLGLTILATSLSIAWYIVRFKEWRRSKKVE